MDKRIVIGVDEVCSERSWQRTLKRIDKKRPDECWLWTGAVTKFGYGRAQIDSSMRYIHRLVLEKSLKRRLLANEVAMHSCDNPPCCNPAHLSVGSPKDNSDDRDRKGRNVNYVGSKHGVSKLTEKDVICIRKLYAEGGITQTAIAAIYGVHKSLISIIICRKGWKHV